MKRMYAILAAVFLVIAALIIGVFIDDHNKRKEEEATASKASADEQDPEEGSKKSGEKGKEDILPSLPFTNALSFQAAKVKAVPGDQLLSLEMYDTEKEEAKDLEDVRHFDFSLFSTSGEVDEEYTVFSFMHIYHVKDGEYHKAGYEDIEAGDMLLLLQDYTNHYYILIYKNV